MRKLIIFLVAMTALTSVATAHNRAVVTTAAQAAQIDNRAESAMWGMPINDAVCAQGPKGNFGCDYWLCLKFGGQGVSGGLELQGHDAVMRDGRVLAGQKMQIVAAC